MTDVELCDLRDRVDIVKVVSEKVILKRHLDEYYGPCPLHGSPVNSEAFRVDPIRKTYFCYECTSGGTVFDFIMARDRISWKEAVQKVAELA